MNAESVPIEVRAARPDDLLAVGGLIQPYVDEGRLLHRTTEELVSLLDHGFVATHAEQVVGFAALEIYSSKLAEVRSLVVAVDYQSQGVGRQLVQACVDLATERHILEVMAITSNENFFRLCGFDFTLPGEKKALFLQTREKYHY